MKFTRITVALAAVAGILLTSLFGIFAAVTACAATALGFLIYSFFKHSFDVGTIILIAVFAAASFSYVISVSSYVHKSLNYINRYVTLEGVVLSTARKTESDNFRYILRVKSISGKSGDTKCSENMLLTAPQKLSCGESVKICGIIKSLPKKMNDNGFDTALYYKSGNIFTRIYSEDISVTDKYRVFSPYCFAQKAIEKADGIIYKYYEGDGAALLSAVLTGNRNNFSSEYNELLSETAFKRVLHPAHLHIWLIFLLLKPFTYSVRKQGRDIFSAVVLLVYAVLQCANFGFMRCLICAAITIFHRLRYGNTHFPDTMATFVLICVIISPTIIFNAAFILSVGGGMLSWAFIPYFMKKYRGLPKFIRKTAAAMTVLALFLTPISAYYYSGLCLYSFFTPPITAPVVLAVIILAPICLLSVSLFGSAPIIGAYLNFAVKILYKIPYVIDALPFSSINIGKPSPTFLIMFICVIFVVYFRIKSRNNAAFLCTAVACGLMFSTAVAEAGRIGTAEFRFVNVGQGDGSVIHTPYGETVIIDGGGGTAYSSYDPGKELFVPYLEAMGINRIEIAVVSHYHQDHIEGVIDTIKRIKTDYVYAPSTKTCTSDDMREWAEKLKSAAEENGTVIRYVTEDTRLKFENGLTLDLYCPKEYVSNKSENDTSLAVKAMYGDFSVLYTGDMSAFAEKSLITYADVKADILKTAHHGSGTSTCAEFVKAVSPSGAVISCGENNPYAHPHYQVLENLGQREIYRTDTGGDIRITARKNGSFKIRR